MGHAARFDVRKWFADHRDVDLDGIDVVQQKRLGKTVRVVICNTNIPIDMPHNVASVAIEASALNQKVIESRAEAVEVALGILAADVLTVARELFRKVLRERFFRCASLQPWEQTLFTVTLELLDQD